MSTAIALSFLKGHDILDKKGYDVFTNSISPEFESSLTDSGINGMVARKYPRVNVLLREAKRIYVDRYKKEPTYGDVLVTRDIVHVLGADCSNRPEKRIPVLVFKPKGRVTCATVFAAYFRALCAANSKKTPHNAIAFVQISTGVFKADQIKCSEMFALALTAFIHTEAPKV